MDNPRKQVFGINGNSILHEVNRISDSLCGCINDDSDEANEKGWKGRTSEQRQNHKRATTQRV
jgi:hypothetical protein